MLEAAHGRRLLLPTVLRVLLVAPILVCAAGATAWAQTPGLVRVVKTAAIVRWGPQAPRDVLGTVEPGTTLEVLDRQEDWYWIVTPPDPYGSRRGAWIAVRDVETVPEQEQVAGRPEPSSRSAAAPPASAPPARTEVARPREAAPVSPAARDEVREPRSYQFADVLFDRDRSSIKPEAAAVLNDATMVLMNDRALQLTIEGHTCSLGTAEYNLALGNRRAAAVRDYLVSHGVTADQLHTVSFGEERPKYDNAHEETRRLNRRVVLVPGPATTPGRSTSR